MEGASICSVLRDPGKSAPSEEEDQTEQPFSQRFPRFFATSALSAIGSAPVAVPFLFLLHFSTQALTLCLAEKRKQLGLGLQWEGLIVFKGLCVIVPNPQRAAISVVLFVGEQLIR